MIHGIDELYQRIADTIVEAIPEPWAHAMIEVIFYEDSITTVGDYTTVSGKLRAFETLSAAREAFMEIRRGFEEAEKPLWGQAQFHLTSDGKFNMKWGYENCDKNGNTIWDPEAWMRRHEERRLRMNRLG